MKTPVYMLLLFLLGRGYAQEKGLHFVVIGDWGGNPIPPYTTVAEKEVAEQMGKTAADIGSKFTVALGDNFYDTGVKDVNDPRFNSTFEVSYYHNNVCLMILLLFAECIHSSSSAVKMVCALWKS